MSNTNLFDFTGIDELYPALEILRLQNNNIESM